MLLHDACAAPLLVPAMSITLRGHAPCCSVRVISPRSSPSSVCPIWGFRAELMPAVPGAVRESCSR